MKTTLVTLFTGLIMVLCLSCERPPREDCPGGDCPDRPPCRDCPKPRAVSGEGDIISQNIPATPFHSITNIGIVNVYITQDSTYSITLYAQPNIIDFINFDFQGGELILNIDENVQIVSSKGISVDVTLPVIQRVTNMGTAYMRLSGPGQDKIHIDNTGTGSINMYSLEVDTCYVNLTGTGSCKVRVNSLLDAIITGTGDVYYQGYPEIITRITGLGKIISAN